MVTLKEGNSFWDGMLSLHRQISIFLQIFFAVCGADGGTVMVLVLTQLMGLYAISSVVLNRKQLPMKYMYISAPPINAMTVLL